VRCRAIERFYLGRPPQPAAIRIDRFFDGGRGNCWCAGPRHPGVRRSSTRRVRASSTLGSLARRAPAREHRRESPARAGLRSSSGRVKGRVKSRFPCQSEGQLICLALEAREARSAEPPSPSGEPSPQRWQDPPPATAVAPIIRRPMTWSLPNHPPWPPRDGT